MKRGFSEWPCSLARAVEVFGDSWTLLIVREGLQGLTRFDEFQRSLNVARNTLSDRLGKLVDAGVMTKRFYQDNPPRYEYLLTEMGRDFFPVLAAMLSWGDKWLDDGGGAPVTLHHHNPGHTIVSQVVCSECGEPVVHADIEFCVGPGYPDDVSPELDIRGRLTPAPGGPGPPLPIAKSVSSRLGLASINASGKPLWNVVIPLILQPPTSFSVRPCALPRTWCPVPKGRSRT